MCTSQCNCSLCQLSARDLYLPRPRSLHMTPRRLVSKTVLCCFSVLRQIRSICPSVTRPVLQALVMSSVSSRLDYCWSAWSRVKQTSSSSMIMYNATYSVISTGCSADATAYWIQDCCARLPVSSRTAPAYLSSVLHSVNQDYRTVIGVARIYDCVHGPDVLTDIAIQLS